MRLESINTLLLELTELLWDFDEYCTVETFDEKRYADLLVACRTAGPKMHNFIVRAHLELLSKLSDSTTSPCALPDSPTVAHVELSAPASPNLRVQTETDAAGAMSPSGRMAFDTAISTGAVPTGYLIERNSKMAASHSLGSGGGHDHLSWPLPVRTFSADLSEDSSHTSQSWPPVTNKLGARDAAALRDVLVVPPQPPPARALPPTPSLRVLSQKCKIDEYSSFHQYKGFCPGAKAIITGDTGVKQKQRPIHRTLSRMVAKCTGCSSELENEQIEIDRANRGMYHEASSA